MTPAALHRLRDQLRDALATVDAQIAALDDAPAPEPFVDDWLSTKEAMKLARVNSEGTIYNWCRLHGFGRKGKNRRYRIDRAPFLAFLEAREE